MKNIQDQVREALAEDRKSNRRRESIRAMLVVFVGIPAVLLAVLAAWVVIRISQGG